MQWNYVFTEHIFRNQKLRFSLLHPYYTLTTSIYTMPQFKHTRHNENFRAKTIKRSTCVRLVSEHPHAEARTVPFYQHGFFLYRAGFTRTINTCMLHTCTCTRLPKFPLSSASATDTVQCASMHAHTVPTQRVLCVRTHTRSPTL